MIDHSSLTCTIPAFNNSIADDRMRRGLSQYAGDKHYEREHSRRKKRGEKGQHQFCIGVVSAAHIHTHVPAVRSDGMQSSEHTYHI